MNKFINFLSFLFLIALARADLSVQEVVISENCNKYFKDLKLDCKDNSECQKDNNQTIDCMFSSENDCFKNSAETTISSIIKCINSCNTSSNDKVKSHYTELAQCYNEKQWPQVEYNQLRECSNEYKKVECGEEGKDVLKCLSQFDIVIKCISTQCNYFTQKSLVGEAECIRKCNKSESKTIQNHFDGFADCLDDSNSQAIILTFASLIYLIFFMLF